MRLVRSGRVRWGCRLWGWGNVLARLERAMEILRTRDGIEFPEHEAFLRHIGRRRRE